VQRAGGQKRKADDVDEKNDPDHDGAAGDRGRAGAVHGQHTFYLADAGGAQDGAALLNNAIFGVLGNDIALTLTMIPESGSLSLGAQALGGAYLLRRRVQRKKKRWNG
jgi:hypothetical protein